ncbi:MAG: hypothetical protein QOF89_3191 [Acidobacteriota bacterium]|nr:hypothetical protein [Acidobacteriota bacterium]
MPLTPRSEGIESAGGREYEDEKDQKFSGESESSSVNRASLGPKAPSWLGESPTYAAAIAVRAVWGRARSPWHPMSSPNILWLASHAEAHGGLYDG